MTKYTVFYDDIVLTFKILCDLYILYCHEYGVVTLKCFALSIKLIVCSTVIFFREVSSKSQSFNMLVFHQNIIVESLKTHLSVKNNMAYQPLLE